MFAITIISSARQESDDILIPLRLQEPDSRRPQKHFKFVFADALGNVQCSGNVQEFDKNNCSFIADKKFIKITIEESDRMLGLDNNCEIQFQLHNNSTDDEPPLLPPQLARLPIEEIYYSDNYKINRAQNN